MTFVSRHVLDGPARGVIPLLIGLLEDSSLLALGRGKGKKPNDAMRLINRIENQQWMLWRGNMREKGANWDDDMASEWTEYQKCFYDARNLKKDVLKRKYRPLATIKRLVREWAEARKTRTADWNPIGAPRSHTRAKVAAALSL